MRILLVMLLGFILSIFVIFLLANTHEQGDTNAISMYFVVFLFPVLLLALVNGLYIKLISGLVNKMAKAILCFIPIAVLSLLGMFDNLTIQGIDGNLTFVAKAGAISLGLTNLIWLTSMLRTKTNRT